MARQETIFLKGEGDAWFDRNGDQSGIFDPVIGRIKDLGIKPNRVFEVGCGTGWRLEKLRQEYDCSAWGIDPSIKAILYGETNYPRLYLRQGVAASNIQNTDRFFDLIIYGFCLYLCDRETLMEAVSEGDRILAEGGYIVIHDFLPDETHCVPYKHKSGVFSYKMDYARLWLANPIYTLIGRYETREGEGISVIRKIDKATAWPVRS